MSGYQRSARRERETVERLRDMGHVAYRTPQSRGAADVIDLYEGQINLVQIKTGGTSPWSHFGPQERSRLLAEAKQAGARAVLFWWPAGRKPLQVIESDRWPDGP